MLQRISVTGERYEWILFTKEKQIACQDHRAGALPWLLFPRPGGGSVRF